MLLLGYANFKSKDKTKEYYKIVLARGCTEKEKEYGNVGYKTVEKFISEEVFNTLNEKMCGADVSLRWGGDEFRPEIIGVTQV